MNEYQGYRIRPSKVCVYYCHLFVRFPASASEILGMTLDFGIGYCIRNNFWQSSNLAVQNGFISRGSSGLPQLFRVAELRGGPSTSFGVFATLSLYRYSLLCTYCTNSRRRFDSARRDRAENCNCSCGEGCGGRAVAARRARRSRDTANVRNVPTRMRLCCLYIASQL
jgi:hypothetical protein